MTFQITVRWGTTRLRYHTFTVDAPDAVRALVRAADEIPDEIVDQVDLVELRTAPDPDDRSFLGEEGEGDEGD